MIRFEFTRIAEAMVSSGIGILGGYLIQKYALNNQIDWIVAIVFYVICTFSLYLIIHLVDYFLEYLSPFFRSYFTQHYFEGKWMQIIDDERFKDAKKTRFSILDIHYVNGEVCVNGQSHSEEVGQQTTSFHALHSEYNQKSNGLNYYFNFTTDEEHPMSVLFGETKLTFGKYNGSRVFNKYKGNVSSNLRDDVRVKAIRVKSTDTFKFDTEISRQKAIATILEAFVS